MLNERCSAGEKTLRIMFGYASTRHRFILGDQIHAKSINKQIKANNTQIFTILSCGSGIGEGDGCEATLTSSVKNGFVLNLLKKNHIAFL